MLSTLDLLDAMAGLSEEQRELLKLLDELRQHAPDQVDTFLEAARGMVAGFIAQRSRPSSSSAEDDE